MRKIRLLINVIIILMLALVAMANPSMSARAGNGSEELKADPRLLQIAEENPDATFMVIVQKEAKNKDLKDMEIEDEVLKGGGQVKKQLDIITSFSAEMTGKEITRLAKHPKVRWISVDAPLVSTAAGDPTVRDEFATAAYSNNNGTQSWGGAWIETGDGSVSASSGYVKVSGGQLQLSNTNRTLSRQANLDGAVSAMLSFKYKRSSLDDAKDYVAIQVSPNGGSNWTELARYAGKASDSAWQSASFNLLSYAAANTQIRFATSATLGSGDILYVDDVQIEYTLPGSVILGGSSTPETELITLNSASSTVTAAAATSLTWSHTVNNGNNRILAVSMLMSSGQQSTSVKYGGLPLTLVGRQSGVKHVVEIWRLVAPPVGTANIVANFSSSLQAIGGAASYNNVDQSTPTGAFRGAVGTSSSPASVTLSSAPGELVIDAMITDVNSTVTPGAGTALRWSQNYTGMDRLGRGGSKAGDTSVTMSWNGPADDWSIAAVPLKPAPSSSFAEVVRANGLWSVLTGQGIGVAVVDSGISSHPDLQGRIIVSTNQTAETDANDNYVHGTHVAGIIGGNGSARKGIAPGANLINVKVSNLQGLAYASDLVDGLQWILDNKATYNIKVANISLNSTVAESYHTSPIDAAVEILWFNGITVVVAAGNNGSASGPVALFPPANDPFVITVGAAEDQGTVSLADDTFPVFSAYGTTENGFAKPDLVAPGRNIVSLLASTNAYGYINHLAHRIDNSYFRMSGTSMSAPMVSGTIALLLQDEPNLTPDQVKYRLMATANTAWPNYLAIKAGAGYLDAFAAVNGTTTQSANTGLLPSQMLSSGSEAITWGSVGWNSVGWNSVGWNSVGWNSVGWNSVGWNSNSAVWDD